MTAVLLSIVAAVLMVFGAISFEVAGEAVAARKAARIPAEWRTLKASENAARLCGAVFLTAAIVCVVAGLQA